MTIAQLTDLHIGLPQEDTYGVDVRGNFLDIIDAIRQHGPDKLIISGDLCYRDGQAEIYAWIKGILDDSGLAYHPLSGNHDDTRLMAEVFGCSNLLRDGELYYLDQWDKQTVICLDSSSGRISDRQLQWLRDALADQPAPILLFIHHPPALMGVPFMDGQHALQNRADLQEILRAHPYPITIFCGHYHTEKSLRLDNLDIHITPSCFFQIDWREQEFAVDHRRIGYRWLEPATDGWQHALRYLDGRQLPA